MARSILLALLLSLSGPARADPTADARAVEERFARACQAGDVNGVMALYADEAIAVWPGQGAEAKGKAEIEKLVVSFCTGRAGARIVLKSVEAVPLDDTHIATVAHWEDSFVRPNGTRVTADVRSTEVLVKKDGTWRYLIDHASIGVPARPAGPRRAPRRR